MSDNLELWKKYEETDKKYTSKYIQGSKELTAVKTMYQIKRASEEWGSMGVLWGVKGDSFKTIELGEVSDVKGSMRLLSCEYTATLFYPDGEINISACKQITFNNKSIDTDYTKKCETDALGKGLSKLGFSAGIYMEYVDHIESDKEYDDKKHVNELSSYKNDKNTKDAIDENPITIEVAETEKVNEKPVKIEKDIIPESKLDKDFIKALKLKKVSKSKQQELLTSISDVIKRAYIKNPDGIDL